MHYLRRTGLLAAFAATFVLGGFLLPDRSAVSGANLFRDVMTLVSTRYIDTLDVSEVYTRAAEGLVSRLDDPYADLFSPEDLEEFTVAYEGHYAGVGMVIESPRGEPIVRRVFPNTPAERHGVRVGDRVVSIDGEAVQGWPLERVANALRGQPGSRVAVVFRRPGVTGSIETAIVRAVVRIPAVPYAAVVEEGVGYIPLLQFNETAGDEVAAAVEELAAQGAKGLVLDLRGNGGGIVEQAIRIAALFLPPNTSVARQWERAGPDTEYRTEGAPLAPDIPLIVLIDEASASASEIVAGALQDHDRAVVVGTTSFGKGLVQTAYRVDGGYVFKMTTGKWYTPAGRTIHRERSAVNGRLVEVEDSVHFATGPADRPTYRTEAGRLVYGGGGIMPDLVARPDTLSTAERALVQAITPVSPDFSLVLFDYAAELQDRVTPDFEVTPAWRDELFRRLADGGVDLDRDTYDAGSRYVDRALTDLIARRAFGDGFAKVRDLDNDAPLLRAIDLIRAGGEDQRALFGYVERLRNGES